MHVGLSALTELEIKKPSELNVTVVLGCVQHHSRNATGRLALAANICRIEGTSHCHVDIQYRINLIGFFEMDTVSANLNDKARGLD